MNIEGTVAIVTGGGSGLGAGTARMLMDAGARVAVLDVNEEGMSPLKDAGALAIRCDVTSAEDAEAAVERVASELGGGARARQLRRHRARLARGGARGGRTTWRCSSA